MIVLAGFAIGGASAATQGQFPVPYQIEFEDFDAFVAAASLTDDEHARCESVFAEYRRRLTALKRAAFERVQRIDLKRLRDLRRELMPRNDEAVLFPGVGGDPKANWAPDDDPRWRELRELEATRHNHRVEESNRGLELLEDTLAQWQAILDERGDHPVTAAMFFLPRLSRGAGGSGGNEYEFRSVNVGALIRSSRGGGILKEVEDRAGRAVLDGGADIGFAAAVDAVEADYAQVYEQYLRQRMLRRGSRRTPEEIVFSRILDESHEPQLRAGGRVWLARHGLDRRFVDVIAALLRDADDDESAQAWIDEYRASVNRELFTDRWPHGMVEWLSGRDDATAEQLDAARALQEQYAAHYALARDRSFELGVRACTETGITMIALPTKPVAHERYFESLADLHLLSLSAAQSFSAVLSESQRADIVQVWRRGIQPVGGDLFGPGLMTQYIAGRQLERLVEARARLLED